jgi:hypothetical protein
VSEETGEFRFWVLKNTAKNGARPAQGGSTQLMTVFSRERKAVMDGPQLRALELINYRRKRRKKGKGV